MKKVKEMFIFDVDGVLTTSDSREIKEEKIITYIINLLKRGDPVAFVTGRPISWIKKNFLNRLLSTIEDSKLKSNIFVSAEKGGVLITFDEAGEEIEKVNEDSRVPDEIRNALRKVAKEKLSKY